jgi:hypothetical protein
MVSLVSFFKLKLVKFSVGLCLFGTWFSGNNS